MILRKNPVSVSNSHDSSFVVSWSVELSEIEDIFGSRTGTREIDWLVSAISVAAASKGKRRRFSNAATDLSVPATDVAPNFFIN